MEFETVNKPEIKESERTGKEKTPRTAKGGAKSLSKTCSKNRICNSTERASEKQNKTKMIKRNRAEYLRVPCLTN